VPLLLRLIKSTKDIKKKKQCAIFGDRNTSPQK